MASNGGKHGDSMSEQAKEKYEARFKKLDEHIARAEIRQEMHSEDWSEEDSKVIHQEVDRRLAERKAISEAPKSGSVVAQGVRGFQKLTTGWPWYGQLVLILAFIIAVATRPDMGKVFAWLGGLF